jgi:hypothetical protein
METAIESIATKTAINPAIITAILAFVASMISGCKPAPTPAPTPTPVPPAPVALTDTRRNRFVVYRAMFEVRKGHSDAPHPLSRAGQELTTELFAQASSAPPETIAEFMSLAQ